MKNKIKIYCITSIFLALILAALRFITLSLFYDAEVGYFTPSLATSVTNALYVIGGLWCLSPIVLIPSSQIKTEFTPNTIAIKASSAFAAILFIFSAFSTFSESTLTKLEIIGAALTAISALFFILVLFSTKSSETIRAFTSISLTVSLILALASLYFDMKIAMNSPSKILGIFILIFGMIFMLCETRTFLGAQLSRLHLASALLTLVFGFSLVSSSILYTLTAHPTPFVSNPLLLGNTGHIAVITGLSVYAAARCFTFKSEKIENEAND